MKAIILILSLIFVQSAFAYTTATQKFNTILPYGTYHGKDCRVKVSRTLRGNIKVNVNDGYRTINYLINPNDDYRFIPERRFTMKTTEKKNRAYYSDTLFLSYSDKGISVLVGKSLYSPENSYDVTAECTIN